MEKRLQKVAQTVIENTRDATRWPWLLLLGFTLIQAVKTVYEEYSDEDTLFNFVEHPFPLITFLLCFIPTFFRFYVGDHRLIELFYFQALEAVRLDSSGAVLNCILSRTKRFLDQIGFFSHAFIFLFLGLSVSNPGRFFRIYVVLMACNIVWIYFRSIILKRTKTKIINLWKSSPDSKEAARRYILDQKEDDHAVKSPNIWMYNNIITTFIMLPTAFWPRWTTHEIFDITTPEALVFLTLVVCLNSAIDFMLTYKFYFPRFTDLLKRLHQEDTKTKRKEFISSLAISNNSRTTKK